MLRHEPPACAIATPISGARIGPSEKMPVAIARFCASFGPLNRSRRMARATTGPTAAPKPCTARPTSSISIDGAASAIAAPAR